MNIAVCVNHSIISTYTHNHTLIEYIVTDARIQWWTTVLQLLVDNNSEVRQKAFMLIDHIPIHYSLPNEFSYLNLFLEKFYECMHNKESELLCVLLFYWGISLLDDADYEMDETDVSKVYLKKIEPCKILFFISGIQ